MQQRTLVEVRKSPKSTTWYNAEIINVKGDSIHVAFLDNVWPSRDTPAQSVRRRPQVEEEDDAFDPQVEDVVEVFFPASETNPSGWSLGSVSSIKTSFYFIGIVGNQRGPQDFIVERGSLRPCSTEPPLEEAQLSRRIVKVPRDLQEWVRSQDSLGCLSHVQKCGELLVAHCLMPEPGSKDPATILLVGDDHNLDLGEKLLAQIHFKNQQEMQKFHVQRERLLQRLEEWKQWFSTRNAEAFSVDQALVGLIVGKKGANINQVRDKYSVEVNVQDQKSGDGNSTVTIIGDTAEAVRKAREELEYITERLELKPEQVGWVLGKGHQNITEIVKKTDLYYARFDDKASCLELCGRRHQVEDAKMLIEVHSEYQTVYRDMDDETSAIRQSFEHLDSVDSGKGKGGRGKGKGGRKGGQR